jgi:phosphomannomutase
VLRALADGGYHDVHVVASQAEPDGDFPTVRVPEPEEPGAMDAALALADEVGADLVIANDPDADRLGRRVPDRRAGHRPLTGNQIGVLLADHLLRHDVGPAAGGRQHRVHADARDRGDAYGARTEVTPHRVQVDLRGRPRARGAEGYTFVYGFEEALGSSVGTVVRDKDGIGAAVAFADLVRSSPRRPHGRRPPRRARASSTGCGSATSCRSPVGRRGARPDRRGDGRLADRRCPTALAGHDVTGRDRLPHRRGRAAAVAGHPRPGRVRPRRRAAMIRPSGTEPKCKIYVDLRAEVGADDDLDARTTRARAEAAAASPPTWRASSGFD